MNSLNILSALGSPPLPPSQPVTHPEKEHREETEDQASEKGQGVEQENFGKSDTPHPDAGDYNQPNYNEGDGQDVITEKSPLLPQQQPTKAFDDAVKTEGFWKSIPKRIASAIIGSLRAVISTLIAPGYYIVAFFYKENGKLSTRSPLHRFGRIFRLGRRKGKAPSKEVPRIDGSQSKHDDKLQGPSSDKLSIVSTASSIGNSTESDIDTDIPMTPDDTPSRNTRSRKVSRRKGGDSEESERPRRIRVQGGESRKEQGSRRSKEKTQSDNLQFDSTTPETEAAAALLKSPKSPATGLKVTKYPKVPSPPQPLIPRRQPSYVFSNTSGASPNKTLIIDLDETLIHSMAKGGRMSTGHMVEVKLQHPVGIGGTTIGPQVPILYYVHKRPYCDEFLRKVCFSNYVYDINWLRMSLGEQMV